MLSIYNFFMKFLRMLLNLLFVLQITIMILVFITAAYWFMSLIGVSSFDFAAPLANGISNFVRIFYNRDIVMAGTEVDGSLLLFNIGAVISVFLITKIKYYIYRIIERVENSIKSCKAEIEQNFNKQLEEQLEHDVKKYKNTAILITYKAKNLMVDSAWGGDAEEGVKEHEDEAFGILYNSLRAIQNCRFAKTGDKMLVLLSDFTQVDNVLCFIEESSNRIREKMKKDKWQINTYMAVEVYKSNFELKSDAYPSLCSLINLQHKNEFICFGNFKLRYNLDKEHMYYIVQLQGSYNIKGGCEVYRLVKKD